MPCYLATSVRVNEKLIVRPDLLLNAMPQIVLELERIHGRGAVSTRKVGEEMWIEVYGYPIKLDLKDGAFSYPDTLKAEANIVKRNYSTQVVRRVAGTGRMRMNFDLKQKSTNEFVLQRRARR